jgi:hypothetical protein
VVVVVVVVVEPQMSVDRAFVGEWAGPRTVVHRAVGAADTRHYHYHHRYGWIADPIDQDLALGQQVLRCFRTVVVPVPVAVDVGYKPRTVSTGFLQLVLVFAVYCIQRAILPDQAASADSLSEPAEAGLRSTETEQIVAQWRECVETTGWKGLLEDMKMWGVEKRGCWDRHSLDLRRHWFEGP